MKIIKKRLRFKLSHVSKMGSKGSSATGSAMILFLLIKWVGAILVRGQDTSLYGLALRRNVPLRLQVLEKVFNLPKLPSRGSSPSILNSYLVCQTIFNFKKKWAGVTIFSFVLFWISLTRKSLIFPVIK